MTTLKDMAILQENYFAVSPSSCQSASTVNIAICNNHLFNKHWIPVWSGLPLREK